MPQPQNRPTTRPPSITVAAAGQPAAAEGSPRRCPALVAQTAGSVTEHTLELRRVRLKAAALILLAGFTVFLVWNRLFPYEPFHAAAGEIGLDVAHLVVVLVLAFCTAALWHPPRCPMRLRFFEFLVFFTPAAFFAMPQFTQMYASKAWYEAKAPGMDPGHRLPIDPIEMWLLLM